VKRSRDQKENNVRLTDWLGNALQKRKDVFDSRGAFQMMNVEEIVAKQKEIEHYEGVLERYQSGRWLDQGRRHLTDLKEELRVLEENAGKHEVCPSPSKR
jgi:hypothetical protein